MIRITCEESGEPWAWGGGWGEEYGQTGGEAGSPLHREALEKVTDSGVRNVD